MQTYTIVFFLLHADTKLFLVQNVIKNDVRFDNNDITLLLNIKM